MNNYVLTVFSKTGEKLLDESFTADNNDAAKIAGKKILEDKGYEDHTYRCVTNNAKLVLFHS